VEAIGGADGPVLSPFAAWIPVYAGQAPSVHFEALWDLDYPGGPFRADLDAIREAVRERRWALVLLGNRDFPYALHDHYEPSDTLIEDKDRSLMPKTGWRARPTRVLVPK
jgi:hypothetical protein